MKDKKSLANDRHEWFKYLFEQRMNGGGWLNCFECHEPMHEEIYKENTICYSHLLEKSQYPQLAGNPDNVVIVHPDCHHLYSMKPKEATNQYNEYLRLKKLYNL